MLEIIVILVIFGIIAKVGHIIYRIENPDYKSFKYLDASYPGDNRKPNRYTSWPDNGRIYVNGNYVNISHLKRAIIIGGGFESEKIPDKTQVYADFIDLTRYKWEDYDLIGMKVIIKNPSDPGMPHLRKVVSKRDEDHYTVVLPDAKRGEYDVKKEEIIGFIQYRI